EFSNIGIRKSQIKIFKDDRKVTGAGGSFVFALEKLFHQGLRSHHVTPKSKPIGCISVEIRVGFLLIYGSSDFLAQRYVLVNPSTIFRPTIFACRANLITNHIPKVGRIE